MSILITVRTLAKRRNGFYVSQKQADFLQKYLNDHEGYVGGEGGTNGYDVFVECDELGITKIENRGHKTQKMRVQFERKGKDWSESKIKIVSNMYQRANEMLDELVESEKATYTLQDYALKIKDDELHETLERTLKTISENRNDVIRYRNQLWEGN